MQYRMKPAECLSGVRQETMDIGRWTQEKEQICLSLVAMQRTSLLVLPAL
jgi:hypothetical protein